MKLIIGLGNPGFRYRNTRHNAGFLVIKELSKRFRIAVKKKTCNGLLGEGTVEGKRVALFAPMTYMNLSGDAVREAIKRKKTTSGDILVICDDISLKLGFIRLREKGSSGGHNGLESIMARLGNGEFPRLRIGIDNDHKPRDAAKFVLSPFRAGEKPLLKSAIKNAAECVILWITDGPDKAMAKFNKRQIA